MVSRDTPGLLARNECELLINVDLNDVPFAKKRRGFRKMNSTPLAGPVQGIFEHRPKDGTRHFMVLAGGTLYRWDGATDTFVTVGSGLAGTPNVRACFVPFGDLLIILNGVNEPRKYDPSTGTLEILGGNPPPASFGAVYYNHLFLSGVAGFPARIWYSETNDPEDGYESKNYFADLIVSDSSAVTAFLPLDQELIVGKRRSITAIRGMDPRDFSQPQNRAAYTNEYGIVHYKAILDVAGVPWFLSDSGVYSLRGPFDLREESWAIHDHIEHLDPTRIQRSFAVHLQQRGQAIFWVPRYNGTHMDLGLVAHPGQGRDERAAWSLWEGPELTAAAVGWDVIEGEVLYLGDANGFVYRESLAYMDDTTPVRAVYRSGPIDIGLPNHLKVLREVGVEAEVAKVTQITVTAITDRDRAVDTRTVTLPAPSYDDEGQDPDDPLSGRQIRRSAVYVAQRGIQHQIKLEHTDGDEFRLSGVELRSYAYGTSRGRKV